VSVDALIDAVPDPISTPEDVAVIVPIFANDSDVPTAGTLVVTQPSNGVVTVNDNGTPNDPSDDIVTYTPFIGFVGIETFTYTICDASLPQICSTATVTVVVSPKTLIAINDETFTFFLNEGGTVPLFQNDTLNGTPITVSQSIFTLDPIVIIPGAYIDTGGNLIVPVGTPVGTYVITYSVFDIGTGQTDSATATIIIVLKDLDIHNAFTPDGDGINEVFQIDGIENYSNNTVCIFNRWGVMVYDAKGYNNDDVSFRGESNGRATISKGEQLPDGTYFYVIKYSKDNTFGDKAGYLYINRR
jgi:gliding motility-associated-like protein